MDEYIVKSAQSKWDMFVVGLVQVRKHENANT